MLRVMIVVALVMGTQLAGAQGDPGAEKLFQDGRTALAAGRVAEACDLFTRSAELERRVGTLLNVGDCREKLGQTATAWSAFEDARALAGRENDARAAEAARRAELLAPALAYLKILVPSELAGLEVTRDGVAIARAGWGVALPVDPGEHVIEARAPGFQPWTGRATVGRAERAELQVPTLVQVARADEPGATTPATTTFARVRGGAGLALGASSDPDLFGGVRGHVELGLERRFGLRATAQLLHTRYHQEEGDLDIQIYSYGLGLDAVYRRGEIAVTAGLGLAIDTRRSIFEDATGRTVDSSTARAFMVRTSPVIARLGPIELGLHLQFVLDDGVTVVGTVGADYVAW